MPTKLKVLIAEDDFLIADMAEEFLVQHGYEVCGIAGTVESAVALGKLHKPDIAVIDYQLAHGGRGTEVGARLKAMGKVGILYATGNCSTDAMTDAVGDAMIDKPYSVENLIRALAIVADIKVTGTTARSFPPRFQLLNAAVSLDSEISHG